MARAPTAAQLSGAMEATASKKTEESAGPLRGATDGQGRFSLRCCRTRSSRPESMFLVVCKSIIFSCPSVVRRPIGETARNSAQRGGAALAVSSTVVQTIVVCAAHKRPKKLYQFIQASEILCSLFPSFPAASSSPCLYTLRLLICYLPRRCAQRSGRSGSANRERCWCFSTRGPV